MGRQSRKRRPERVTSNWVMGRDFATSPVSFRRRPESISRRVLRIELQELWRVGSQLRWDDSRGLWPGCGPGVFRGPSEGWNGGADSVWDAGAFGAEPMNGAQVLDLARDGIWVMILIGAPMMIAGLVVGVVIALFQALTQIQEMTLVFVPKILTIFVTMLIALPFMGATLGAYMNRLADMIINGG
jgi:flagellar biosynthetic protein FliQ